MLSYKKINSRCDVTLCQWRNQKNMKESLKLSILTSGGGEGSNYINTWQYYNHSTSSYPLNLLQNTISFDTDHWDFGKVLSHRDPGHH